jgi:hypothetical protein
MSSAMVGLGVLLGPRMPETLIEDVRRLPSMVRELELSTTHCVQCTGSSPGSIALPRARPHDVEWRLGPGYLR